MVSVSVQVARSEGAVEKLSPGPLEKKNVMMQVKKVACTVYCG
jgi:hypothetical protein